MTIVFKYSYLFKVWLVKGCIFPLQFMNLLVKFGFYVGALNLKVLQGIYSSLYSFR